VRHFFFLQDIYCESVRHRDSSLSPSPLGTLVAETGTSSRGVVWFSSALAEGGRLFFSLILTRLRSECV